MEFYKLYTQSRSKISPLIAGRYSLAKPNFLTQTHILKTEDEYIYDIITILMEV